MEKKIDAITGTVASRPSQLICKLAHPSERKLGK